MVSQRRSQSHFSGEGDSLIREREESSSRVVEERSAAYRGGNLDTIVLVVNEGEELKI